MNHSSRIKQRAKELGFELVGIAPAQPPPDYDFFLWWLDQGFAGTMDYLKRGAEKRGDPEKILPGVRSIVCCGINYYTEGKSDGISRYVWGEDYHEVVGERLEALEKFIQEIAPTAKTRRYVDTGPLLERSYAAKSGLGWIGKNSCLINNGIGSYVFLGEVLTTLDFTESEYDRPVPDQCGTCRKCLEACPTQALVEPYVLDSNRCISYLTIEYRGDFSPEQEKMVGDHLYGCDICQEVCPYNERIPATPLKAFQPREAIRSFHEKMPLQEVQKGSAMERIRGSQWLRNLKSRGKVS